MSNTNNTNLYLIIGVIVLFVSCISCISGLFLITRKKEVVAAPSGQIGGQIGGPCLQNGICSDKNSVCRFNMCYEQCKGRNAWPCENDGDIPITKTYWCDYATCPAWVPPSNDPTQKPPSAFDNAVAQLAENDKLKAETAAAQQKLDADAAAKAKADAIAAADVQGNLCKCKTFAGSSYHHTTPCSMGKYHYDGSEQQTWCYVDGGTQCTTAKPSLNGSQQQGMAWRLC